MKKVTYFQVKQFITFAFFTNLKEKNYKFNIIYKIYYFLEKKINSKVYFM